MIRLYFQKRTNLKHNTQNKTIGIKFPNTVCRNSILPNAIHTKGYVDRCNCSTDFVNSVFQDKTYFEFLDNATWAVGFHLGLRRQQVTGEITIHLDNIKILEHSNTEQMEANGTNQTKWLNSLKIPVTSQTKIVLVPDIPLFMYCNKRIK